MKTAKTMMLSILLAPVLSVMFASSPAFANWFSNPRTNTMLNVGSAKSPTPEQLRAIGDSNYAPATYRTRNIEPAAAASESLSYDDEDISDNGALDEETGTATAASLTGMEGKTVLGAKGERLGYVLAVDNGSRQIELQTRSGIGVAMPASLVADKGRRVVAPSVSRADVLAMAKAQTGRTVALTIDMRKRNTRG
jgi:hypothetical protein